jgi:hypothetical protein
MVTTTSTAATTTILMMMTATTTNKSCLLIHFLFISVPSQQANGQLQKQHNILTQGAINKEQTHETSKRTLK